MQTVREQYDAVMHAKSAREFFENIPWGFVERLAMIPAAAIILSALYQLVITFTAPYVYSYAINIARRIGLIFGLVVIVIFTAKKVIEKESFPAFIRQNQPFAFFLVLMLLMLLSTVVNGFTDYALFGDSYRNESLFVFLMYFGIYYFCSSVIQNPKLKKVMLYLFVFVSLIVNGVVLFSTCVLQNNVFSYSHLLGIFQQYNHYAYYLTVAVILSAVLTVLEQHKLLKAVNLINFLITSVALNINATRGCFLSCIAALIFSIIAVSIVQKKVSRAAILMFVLFLLISFVTGFFYPTVLHRLNLLFDNLGTILSGEESEDQSSGRRLEMWINSVKLIGERPLLGFGVEGISDRIICVNEPNQHRPHNEYLQYAVFFGIPACLAYIAGIWSSFRTALKNKAQMDIYSLAAFCTAAAYLCSALFGNTMYYTAPYLFIFLGLGFGMAKKSE